MCDRYQVMPTMVEARQVTCPSCGTQTVTLCTCEAGSRKNQLNAGATHCPKCAGIPMKQPHVWIAQGRR